MIKNKIQEKILIPKIEIKEEPTEKYENISLNLERNTVSDNINDYNDYQTRLSNLVNFNYEEEITGIEQIQEKNTEYVEEVKDNKNKLLGVYLIDQHAAQERINYEKYSYLLSHPSDNIITTLVPIILEFPMNDYLIIKKNIDIIKNMNIDIEEFGQSAFRISSHPTWFPRNNPDKTIRNILEQIIKEEKNFNLARFNDHLAATMACKASVKGNTRITIEDMESLISQLRNCNNPFNCPHGRPTIIEFTIYELEKMFKRSI